MLFKDSFSFSSLSLCEMVRKRRFFLGALLELVFGVKMFWKELITGLLSVADGGAEGMVVEDIDKAEEDGGVSRAMIGREFKGRKSADWLVVEVDSCMGELLAVIVNFSCELWYLRNLLFEGVAKNVFVFEHVHLGRLEHFIQFVGIHF